MKTKNNVQKTILRSGAVIISFVLITFTVSAQEFWKKLIELSSFNDIAIAMTETSDKTKIPADSKKDVQLNFVDYAVEDDELEVEQWMLDEVNFSINPDVVKEKLSKPEMQTINSSVFETGNSIEEPLHLESWITSEEIWNS